MIKFEEIKCIIWDLDDTLWEGAFLEGEVYFSDRNKALIQNIDKCGVIQTICSKNKFEDIKKKLNDSNVWEYFISPMISYESKAAQIQSFCEIMHFRYENCLFIDDNLSNLKEVQYYCPGIQTCQVWDISEFEAYFGDEQRLGRNKSRRDYYRMLEMKQEDKAVSQSPIDFLRNSNIRISIKTPKQVHFERIYELIKRTNQLNYTKKRISRKELRDLLDCPSIKNYCIHAWDQYGDYGIIGFISLVENRIEHLLFSCRVLGMGIEQYVYQRFGMPELSVKGEVATEFRKMEIDWIKETEEEDTREKKTDSLKKTVLLKGPCDIRSILSYFGNEELFDTEFTYTNERGVVIEQINHTFHAVQSINMNREKIEQSMGMLPFYDREMYSDKMFKNSDYQVICYSVITDSNLGVYKHRESGVYVAFGEYKYPLTDSEHWKDYINHVRFSANCEFDEPMLKEFAEKFEFVGRISEEQFRTNLRMICEQINPDCQLILMTGVELHYEDNENANYEDRYLNHAAFRKIAEEVALEFSNVHVFSFAPYIRKQEDFFEHYNHFQKYVYYDVAVDLAYMLRTFGIDTAKIISY